MASKHISLVPDKGLIPVVLRDGPKVTLKTKPEDVEKLLVQFFKTDPMPNILGMCDWMGVLYKTFNKWMVVESRCPFVDILKKYHQIIGSWTVRNAMKSRIQPVFAMFTLKNTHNWVDKREETINHTLDINVQFKDMIKTKKLQLKNVSRETLDHKGEVVVLGRGPISKA